MKIEMIKVSDIKPYEKNAKRHTEEQVTYIANSIREFGFQQPLVVDSDNVLVIGHGRLKASKRLGLSKVPCIRVTELSEEQVKALRVADNKTNESEWDDKLLNLELGSILDLDMTDFGFDLSFDSDDEFIVGAEDEEEDLRDPSCQHNVFENQEIMQFISSSKWGIPDMSPTQTVGDKMLRFMDWKECDNPAEYIAHFYYDDYKFMSAWRDPNKYVDRLREFKAVVSPDFSLYTDFPRALQILSCYRRQWCGAYWQTLGIDVIPDVVWGDEDSYEFCFDGIPKGSTVAVSTVGVARNEDWNGKEDNLFLKGYNEMLKRLEPTTIILYGAMLEGLEGNIIRVPGYYEEKRNRVWMPKEGDDGMDDN